MTPQQAAHLLTVPEVAERLRLCPKTIRRMIDRGELRVHRIGRQLRISEEDLDAYLRKTRS
jgi:excisionase family DNA binding protein